LVALYEPQRSSYKARSGASNSFDNGAWSSAGPGKRIAGELESEAEPALSHDASTNALIGATARLGEADPPG